ncbi:MAG: hypothetical protein EXS21_00340 [Pedosphaera sp.]|nr:hypothetical protein [Pedosphaera sp.]
MNSTKAIFILLGLIVGLNLGLRRSWGPEVGLDRSDSTDVDRSGGAMESHPSDSVRTSNFSSEGFDGRSRGHGSRWAPSPISEPPPTGSVMDAESQDLSLQDVSLQDLSSLVQGFELAATPEEQGPWADRIAASGGTAAVEALIQAVTRASLNPKSPEEAEVLREAFKGFSTEDEMAALAMSLVQTQDIDLIEAVVDTLARGARSSTVEQLVRLHDEAATSATAQAALGWAIERIRNPEASHALVRLVGNAEQPELAHAGIIALSSIQSQAIREPDPSP